MTDVLYVLADKENRGSDRELRLSLRSLQKNCKDLGRVFIVTDELPDWIQNVEHIECKDFFDAPEQNVMQKVFLADISIQSSFLFMNDDFFMMKPFVAMEYPYYHCGKMVYIYNPSRWQKVNNATINRLCKAGKDYIDYRIHCPILYNGFLLWQILDWALLEANAEDYGYSLRCLYGNFLESDNKKQVLDCKLWHGESLRESETSCISTADGADDVLDQIESIFNKRSRYEKF